jgi:hypothetical protein
MKRIIFLIIMGCLFILPGYAQVPADSTKVVPPVTPDTTVKKQEPAPAASTKKDTRPLKQRIDFSLTTSFWVNSKTTFFEFSPTVAYLFPKIFSIGLGPVYMVNKQKETDITLTGWGAKVFAKAQLLKWIYAYTEYQGINSEYITDIDLSGKAVNKEKQYVDSWFLSAGLNLPVGRRKYINLQALYDVLYDKDTSPYYSAWIYRVGFGFW